MAEYESKINVKYVSKELTPIEEVQLEDAQGTALDQVVKSDGTPFLMEVGWYAIVEITSEKVEDGAYNKYLIADKHTGELYTTSSKAFGSKFEHIMDKLHDWKEPWTLVIRKAESSNRKGAQFITCSVRPGSIKPENEEVPFEA